MDKQSFRQMGYEIIDWIADYMESGYDGPVNPPVKPGAMRAQLPKSAPEQPESPAQIMADFKSMILPNTLHWNDPRFYGYFPCNHSGPAILGDLLGNGLGVNAMSWATCPSATELEIQVMQWLGKAIGLEWPGVIQDTASTGVFCALLAARESVANGNRDGFYDSAPLVAYTSDQAHSSLLKAMRMAGLGDRYMRLVPTLEDQSMDTDVLVRMIDEDIEAGHRPFFICGTIGTTSTTAVDPILEISEIADEYDIWFHVDAALAGTAALLPEMEWLMEGVEQADSFLFNPHKWMFTSFDCCAFFIKDPAALKHALSIQPEYLKTAADGAVENFRDWSIQLGRRFRALKLWFVLRLYGLEGIREKIRLHLAMTQDFARWVEDQPGLHLFGTPRIQTVCFHLGENESTKALMERINATGEAFMTHTVVQGQYLIRVSFGQAHGSWETLDRLKATIQGCLDAG